MNMSLHRLRTLLGALAVFLVVPAASYGAGVMTFSVVANTFQANTSNQTFTLFISDSNGWKGPGNSNVGKDTWTGLSLRIQINDGGANVYNVNNNGTNAQDGPFISGISLLTAGLLATDPNYSSTAWSQGGNNGPITPKPINGQPNTTESQAYEDDITTTGSTDFLPFSAFALATITIDTNGAPPGSFKLFALATKAVSNGDTGAGIPNTTYFGGSTKSFAEVSAQTLSVAAPEPASLGLFMLLIPGLIKRRRRAA